MSRRILLALTTLALVAALTVAAAGPAAAATFRRSVVHSGGAITSLQFTESGAGSSITMSDVRGGLQLPSSWANRFCAYAVVYVGGRYYRTAPRQCDTNGDAHLVFWFGTLTGHDGETVSIWFSDPESRYDQDHAALIL